MPDSILGASLSSILRSALGEANADFKTLRRNYRALVGRMDGMEDTVGPELIDPGASSMVTTE